MGNNVKIAKELVKLAKNLVAAVKYDYMPEKIIEENNVVAGRVCYHCKFFRNNGYDCGDCEKLECITYPADVCKNFEAK